MSDEVASQKGASRLRRRKDVMQVFDLSPPTAAVIGAVALAHYGSPALGMLFFFPTLGVYAYIEKDSSE